MINSIQHFQEQGVKNLTEIFSHYTDDLTKFACEKAGTLNAGMKRSF
ncbi:MAG: hypothetical protein KH362_12535 [Roseburia sp.]|nr:hypothetical protein [Roseburia sp.]